MKLFTSLDFSVKHEYPETTGAIVIANNVEEAVEILNKEMLSRGKDPYRDAKCFFEVEDLEEVEMSQPKLIMANMCAY